MKNITINNRKQGTLNTLVDDEDFEYLNQWKWFYTKYKTSSKVFRIERGIKEKGSFKCKTIYMHREIMKAGKGKVVDHIDHNPLNNQKENLRLCSYSQNSMNMTPRKSLSKYKGVCFRKGKWNAHITLNYKQMHLGVHDTEEQAALAYNIKAKELFGEFAYLNKIGEE